MPNLISCLSLNQNLNSCGCWDIYWTNKLELRGRYLTLLKIVELQWWTSAVNNCSESACNFIHISMTLFFHTNMHACIFQPGCGRWEHTDRAEFYAVSRTEALLLYAERWSETIHNVDTQANLRNTSAQVKSKLWKNQTKLLIHHRFIVILPSWPNYFPGFVGKTDTQPLVL